MHWGTIARQRSLLISHLVRQEIIAGPGDNSDYRCYSAAPKGKHTSRKTCTIFRKSAVCLVHRFLPSFRGQFAEKLKHNLSTAEIFYKVNRSRLDGLEMVKAYNQLLTYLSKFDEDSMPTLIQSADLDFGVEQSDREGPKKGGKDKPIISSASSDLPPMEPAKRKRTPIVLPDISTTPRPSFKKNRVIQTSDEEDQSSETPVATATTTEINQDLMAELMNIKSTPKIAKNPKVREEPRAPQRGTK